MHAYTSKECTYIYTDDKYLFPKVCTFLSLFVDRGSNERDIGGNVFKSGSPAAFPPGVSFHLRRQRTTVRCGTVSAIRNEVFTQSVEERKDAFP